MFTRNIRTAVQLGKSGVRWDGVGEGFNLMDVNQKNSDELLKQANDLINGIKDKDSWAATDWLRMQQIRDIMRRLGNENNEKRNTIISDIKAAKKDASDEDKKRFEELEEDFKKAYTQTDEKKESGAVVITAITNDRLITVLPQDAPAISENGAQKPVEYSKDSNINAIITAYGERFMTKQDLAKALSRAEKNAGGFPAVYERVTGEQPGTPLDFQKFNKSLNTNIQFLQQFDGGNAGLDAILQGKVDVYLKKVAEYIKAHDGKAPEIKIPQEGLPPQVQTIAGAIATILVATATNGIVIVGHEAQNTSADTFIKDFEADKEGGFWHGLGKGLVWLKEAFMGRKLSITLGANEKEGNVIKYKEDIREFTKEVMESPDLSKSTNPKLQEIYPAAKQFADKAGVETSSDTFKKALIQSYILNEGYAREGVDWKANIGLLFIGAGREQIKIKREQTVGDSEHNNIEKTLTHRQIDSKEWGTSGVQIIKNSDGKWEHSIPTDVQFAGDPTKIPVMIPGQTPVDGKYTIVVDKVQILHFSDSGRGYVVTLSDSKNQPAGGITSVSPTGDVGKQSAEIRNVRENLKDKSVLLADKMYYIGHANPETFGKLLALLAGQASKEQVQAELDSIKKNNPLLSKQLEKELDALVQSGNTYTYGTFKDRGRVSADQSAFDRTRTEAVINAEKRLAVANGITFSTNESEFKQDTYQPKQASEIFPGQEMTLSVFATPIVGDKDESHRKAGVHRIDTMDGSFAVSSKYVEITDATSREQVIAATEKLIKNPEKGIDGQVKKLNEFLRKNGVSQQVNKEDYLAYLKSGDEKQLGVDGLSVQKKLKVFEARAMIAGNMCLNRTNGVVYPLFELNGVKQGASVATLDYSTPINMEGVETRLGALGLNPIPLAMKLSEKGKGGEGIQDSTEGGGTQTPDATPTDVPTVPTNGPTF